jgi:hypothetical protein
MNEYTLIILFGPANPSKDIGRARDKFSEEKE